MRVINIKGLTQEWATNDNHFIVHITQGTLYCDLLDEQL